MYKLAAALGVVSASKPITIDVFGSPQSFIRADYAKALFANANGRLSDNDLGIVTFKQCSDDANVFTFDEPDTTYSPMPIVKGSDLGFDLWGTVSDTMEVTNVHIHVIWNGATLYDQDIPGDDTYTSDYEKEISW